MARTPSNMLPLGTEAPEFNLVDSISGKRMSLEHIKGPKGTLIIFMCNHCPFVIHILDEIERLSAEYKLKSIDTIAISSNDVANYPEDSPEKMKELAEKMDFVFPYLYDETQEVAKAYDAACTPDFYLFDDKLKLVYRGQLDNSRPGNGIPVTGEDLRAAMDNLLEGKEISKDQKPSLGCNIKWK